MSLTTNQDDATIGSPAGSAPNPPDPDAVLRAWSLSVGFLLLSLAAMAFLFWNTFAEMVASWDRASAYKHCYLIAPISLYLIWDQRDRLTRMMPSAGFWGLPVVLAFGMAWLIADIANIDEGRQFAVVGMMQGLFLTVLGWPVYRALAFPLLFLFLAVPTGGYLLPWMQAVATDITVAGLRLIGIPVFAEGIIITVPTGIYRVAPGCAGLNFLLSGVAFALLYGYLMYRGWVKPVLALVTMVVVVFAANGIRIIGIITVAHFIGEKIDIVDDHYFYGWGFFAVVLLALMWFGLRFRDDEPLSTPSPATSRARPLTLPRLARTTAAVCAAVVVAAAAPAYAAYANQSDPGSVAIAIPLPDRFGPWQAVDTEPAWRARLAETDREIVRVYSDGRRRVTVHIGYYWRQDERREVAGQSTQMADERSWSRLSSGRRNVAFGDDVLSVHTQRLSQGTARRIVWYWYWVGGDYVAATLNAKINQVLAALSYGEQRAAVIAVSTVEESEPDRAAGTLADFLAAGPGIARALAAAAPPAAAPAQGR